MQVRRAKGEVRSKFEGPVRPTLLLTYFALLASTFALASCAVKAAPPLPPALKYPEFVYPLAVPASAPQAAAVDRGWRFLQNDDLRDADREFGAALKIDPAFAAARTGVGYVDVARKDYMPAVDAFDAALRESPAYVPAFVGKGLALL